MEDFFLTFCKKPGLTFVLFLVFYNFSSGQVISPKYKMALTDSILVDDSLKVLYSLNQVWITGRGIWENNDEERILSNGITRIRTNRFHPTLKLGKRISISTGGKVVCMCEREDSLFVFNGLRVFGFDKKGILGSKSRKLKIQKDLITEVFHSDSKFVQTAIFTPDCRKIGIEMVKKIPDAPDSLFIGIWDFHSGPFSRFPDLESEIQKFQFPVVFCFDSTGTKLGFTYVFESEMGYYYHENPRQASVFSVGSNGKLPGQDLILSENWGNVFFLDSTTIARIRYSPVLFRESNPFSNTEQEYYSKIKKLDIVDLKTRNSMILDIPDNLEFLGSRGTRLFFRNLFPGTIFVFEISL